MVASKVGVAQRQTHSNAHTCPCWQRARLYFFMQLLYDVIFSHLIASAVFPRIFFLGTTLFLVSLSLKE